MDSVRPDKEIAALRRAVLKVGGHATFVLLDVEQSPSTLDVPGTESLGQKGDEVGPVEMVVGRPVLTLHGVTQFFAPQDTAILPTTKNDRGGTDRDARHSAAKPVTAKQARSVGADLNARPDLTLLEGLLEQRNLKVGPTQRNGARQSSDASADHQSMKTFHDATSQAPRIRKTRSRRSDGLRCLEGLALPCANAVEPTAHNRLQALQGSGTLDAVLPLDAGYASPTNFLGSQCRFDGGGDLGAKQLDRALCSQSCFQEV
jgi:hypothetical protein